MKPTITIHDALTNETIEREMNEEEAAVYEAIKNAFLSIESTDE